MILHAAAVLPLILSLKAPGKWTRNCYADDSPYVADLPSLQTWFEELLHGVQIMATIQNSQRQCWLLVLLMFSRLLNCLQISGLGLFLVDNFWMDLFVMIF